jgi:hypothetical protein
MYFMLSNTPHTCEPKTKRAFFQLCGITDANQVENASLVLCSLSSDGMYVWAAQQGRGAMARGMSRNFAVPRDNNEHRLRSLERELGLRPPPEAREHDVLANAKAMLEDMEGSRWE